MQFKLKLKKYFIRTKLNNRTYAKTIVQIVHILL